MFRLPHCQLSHCLAISLDLLSNELLVSSTLINLESVVGHMLLKFLLNDPNIIHPCKVEIEIVHHLGLARLLTISTGRHLLQ